VDCPSEENPEIRMKLDEISGIVNLEKACYPNELTVSQRKRIKLERVDCGLNLGGRSFEQTDRF
jgi:hypothetical protein